MGTRDGMTPDDWENNRGLPEFLKEEQPVAQRSQSADDLLRQLLNEQKNTNRMLAAIGKLLQKAINAKPAAPPAQAPSAAPRVDLDSERGNFRVNKDPPKWPAGNESFAGRLLSECSPEFLDELAGFYDWQIWKANDTLAKTPDDEKALKTLKYKPMDLARINGWAARIRNGYGGGASQQQESDGGSAPEQASDGLMRL